MTTPSGSERLESAIHELVAALLDELRGEAAGSGIPDRLLSVDEAAQALSIGRSRLYDELESGRLRSLRVGRRRLVPASAIGEYVAAADGTGR
jgi:excisionase family DNA binding protein